LASLEIPIEAKQAPLKDILGESFRYDIPKYQRPFSWDKEQFQKLVEDVADSLSDSNGEGVYFLGAIVIFNKESNLQEIIDGQQRLVALTVLLACIRDLIKDQKNRASLKERIYQEEDELTEKKKTERVHPWKKLEGHFNEYIYKDGGSRSFLKDFKPS